LLVFGDSNVVFDPVTATGFADSGLHGPVSATVAHNADPTVATAVGFSTVGHTYAGAGAGAGAVHSIYDPATAAGSWANATFGHANSVYYPTGGGIYNLPQQLQQQLQQQQSQQLKPKLQNQLQQSQHQLQNMSPGYGF
jgi:hypothetical protein